MATGVVMVSVVDVGQGQCTFVEIYDRSSTPKLIHTLLFDCGSDKQSDETQNNLQYIVDKVSSMTTPTFDCIFFSHSDKDHIILTYDLLGKFSSSKKPKISEIWYGGDWNKYTKNGYNILDYIVHNNYCLKANIKTTGSNYTGYSKTTGAYTNRLWRSADSSVYVYPIVSNTLSDDPDWDDNDLDLKGKTAEALNRVSMICGLYYAGSSYVICGDATNATMSAANTLFDLSTTIFNQNLMTTLPHHGSRATGFAVAAAYDASSANVAVVDTFVSNLKSQSITVSAFAKHRHPSLQIMKRFMPTTTTPILRDPRLVQKNAHRITANIDLDLGTISGVTIFRSLDYSFESLTNTFTTRYYDGWPTFAYELNASTAKKSLGVTSSAGAINGFASWKYETQTNGNFLLGGYANLSAPLFTGPTVKLVHTSEAEEFEPYELLEEKAPLVSVRLKTKNTKAIINAPSQLNRLLKQFH